MGASQVIGVDSDPVRLAMSQRMGADVALDFTKVDVFEEVMRLTGGRGADVTIEALGTQQTFETALRCLRPGGTLSSLGVYSGKLEMPYAAFAAGLGDHRIVTTLCPGGKERMGRLIAMVQSGRFDPTPLLTHRFPLARDRRGVPGVQQPPGRRPEGRDRPVSIGRNQKGEPALAGRLAIHVSPGRRRPRRSPAVRPPRRRCPRMSRRRFVLAREPSTIMSAPSDCDASRIDSAGSPSQISQVAATPERCARRTIACAPAVRRSRSWSTRRIRPPDDPDVVGLDDAQNDEVGARRAGPSDRFGRGAIRRPRLVDGEKDPCNRVIDHGYHRQRLRESCAQT